MAASDLVLKVDPASFKATVSTLEGYVQSLQNLKGQYEQKKSEIDSVWTGDTAEKYKVLIQTEIDNVTTAINELQAQIEQINKLLENHEYTVSQLDTDIEAARKTAQQLFM